MRVPKALLAATAVVKLLAVRRWSRSWGSTPAERAAALSGDELVLNPRTSVTQR